MAKAQRKMQKRLNKRQNGFIKPSGKTGEGYHRPGSQNSNK